MSVGFSVLVWRAAVFPHKHFGKIAGMVVTAGDGNLRDAEGGVL